MQTQITFNKIISMATPIKGKFDERVGNPDESLHGFVVDTARTNKYWPELTQQRTPFPKQREREAN
jgi:hypothetical protein